ncbi:MAG: CHASE domain-containing protein [Planctomycetota bacterium]|nr:CHASE domain-containing protein [Planctomycetota bacterium]
MPETSNQAVVGAHPAQRKPPWGIFAVFLLGIGLAVWIYQSLRQFEEQAFEAAFEQQADLRFRSLRTQLNYCREQLKTLAAFYSSSNFVDREEFKGFVEPILERQPAAVSVEWIPWVPKDKRPAFEAMARADGLAGFAIQERTGAGLGAAGVRESYLPVFYQEPKIDPATFGLDVSSLPEVARAIAQARDFGEIAAGPCELSARGPGPNPSLSLYQPVYEHGPTPVDLDQRRARFAGCYRMTFQLQQVVRRAWMNLDRAQVDCYLLDLDMPEGRRLLYEDDAVPEDLPEAWHDERPYAAPPAGVALWQRKELSHGGRRWEILSRSTPQLAAAHRSMQPLGALAGLLGFTLLLTVYLWSGRNRRLLVEELVLKRTGELEEARAGLEEKVLQRTLEIRRANQELTDAVEKLKRAQEALHVTQMAVDTAAESMLRSDATGRVLEANETTCLRLGYRREQLCQTNLEALFEGIRRETWAARWAAVTPGGLVFRDTQIARDGRRNPVEITASRFRHGDRELCSLFVKDLTEHKRLEEQLVQSQKMESVGRLAGGVAHDFNNILTVIQGHCEVAMLAQGAAPQSLERIQEAANRAAALTRQLLAFARKHPCVTRRTNLNELVARSLSLVKPLLGERVDVTLGLAPDLGAVQVDPAQIEQVLLNLALNAKDAMPEGGTLALATRMRPNASGLNLDLPRAASGPLVEFSIADSGTGMSGYVLQHLFEPFFTTKAAGKGTGLGLAMCYGIVKQNGGDIRVQSEEGKGTVFSIYFPVSAQAAPPAAAEALAPPAALAEPRHVLLVEDETEVRELIADILRRNGCRVEQAETCESGVRVAAAMHPPPDLVITDVVLPKASGRELAHKVRAIFPGVRVLYISGYTGDNAVQDDVKDGLAAYLPKPFSMQMLIDKVKSIFEAQNGRARAAAKSGEGQPGN